MRNTGPLALVVLERFAVLRQGGFERVRFTGEVALSFVINRSGKSSGRLDSGSVGELDVRGTPNDTLDS